MPSESCRFCASPLSGVYVVLPFPSNSASGVISALEYVWKLKSSAIHTGESEYECKDKFSETPGIRKRFLADWHLIHEIPTAFALPRRVLNPYNASFDGNMASVWYSMMLTFRRR